MFSSTAPTTGRHQRFGLYRFQTPGSIAYGCESQILPSPVCAALDTLDVNTVNIAFKGKVSPAPLACFWPDDTEHISPFVVDFFSRHDIPG